MKHVEAILYGVISLA